MLNTKFLIINDTLCRNRTNLRKDSKTTKSDWFRFKLQKRSKLSTRCERLFNRQDEVKNKLIFLD